MTRYLLNCWLHIILNNYNKFIFIWERCSAPVIYMIILWIVWVNKWCCYVSESPPPPYCLIPANRGATKCEGKQFKRRLVVVDSPASGYYYTYDGGSRCDYAHILFRGLDYNIHPYIHINIHTYPYVCKFLHICIYQLCWAATRFGLCIRIAISGGSNVGLNVTRGM